MEAPTRLYLLILWLLTFIYWCAGECEIETGESVIIMDILESRGNQINQTTTPSELPISGTVPEIELKIQTATNDYFDLIGKTLHLKKPIDRDEVKLTLVRLQILCKHISTSLQVNIPVVIRIGDINDNPPLFKSLSYQTMVSELTPVGTIIYRELSATDKDSDNNGLIEYMTERGDSTETDGYPYFAINLPHQGLVTVRKALDYEKSRIYYLTVLAVDKAINPSDRLTSTTTLTIRIADGDDQDPAFVYGSCTLVNNACVNAEYKAEVTSGVLTGLLKIQPEPILAKDRDSLNSVIQYSFVNGTPSFYDEYFEIDSMSGKVKQIKALERSQARHLKIVVKAEEMTDIKRFATAKLIIDVHGVDNSPPVIIPSSFEGFVDENSPVGTTVTETKNGKKPLHLAVVDADIDEDTLLTYVFEVTTNSFRVNADGYVIVNEANLDRDPPNPSKYTFQVIARQINSDPGKGASAPVTMSIYLNDVNDNSPRLPSLPTIRLQAGDGVRNVTMVKAEDVDSEEFAKIMYSIYHVSNNGQTKFRINRDTGLVEAIDKLSAGEQYSITVQATDAGGRFSQGILDVVVVPGPNTGGPVFSQDKYNTQVSEGASVDSAIITVVAKDPEKDNISYSIVDGNINEDFKIDEKSGTVYTYKRLDREEVSTYNLIIRATDPSGLFSTTSVAVHVTDINDQNPVFFQNSYNFKVNEGISNAEVGVVQAHDDDISVNGEITYSISGTSDFAINSKTGQIQTLRALDFERQQVYRIMATAKDQAPDARFATASVTVFVVDIQDEKPYFEKQLYEATVPENEANYEIVQVKATDPDSIKSVTYIIRDGETSLFAIDSSTGVLKTLRPLDYEHQSSYSIIIGTLENDNLDRKSTTTVVINLKDKNDVAPVFTSVPLPIRIQDTVPLGTIVTTVVATDADGSPPGSEVRYELSGKEKAPSYFLIDSISGLISVKDDLRKEPDSEYRIEVKASDLGSPPLSATATVTVYVEHIATVAPDSGLGFADSRYNVEVEENSLANTLIKTLTVINKPRGNFPIGCRIDGGNEEGLFYVIENNQRDCELRLQSQNLDFEKRNKYLLTIRLVTVGGLYGSSRLTTDVAVSVIDINDNRPEFVIPPRYSNLVGRRYLSALPYDSAVGTNFIQVMAQDRDSGFNGKVTYEITPDSDPYRRFRIDPTTGFISNSKSLEDVSPEELPMKLKIVARDNPQLRSALMLQSTEVMINVIRDENRMVMVLKEAFPDKVLSMKDSILRIIQDRTGIITDAEKVVSLKMMKNNTIETDASGSDLWFYAVDPVSLRILEREDPKVKSTILEKNTVSSLLKDVSRTVGGSAIEIRPPLLYPIHSTTMKSIEEIPPLIIVRNAGGPRPPATTDGDVSDLGAALIALACIIVVLGFVGIIYHCCMWSRYIAYRERMRRLYLAPRYEPVFVEPSLKEYETQVLQMSVPLDEEGSINDAHLSLTLRGMEGISYIGGMRGKDGSVSAFGGGSQTHSHQDNSFSTTAESLDDSRSSVGQNSTARATSSLSANNSEEPIGLMAPATNPLFNDSGQDDDEDTGERKSLHSDDNLTLVETHEPQESQRTLYTVENTTEL